jgi:hypothetical protein
MASATASTSREVGGVFGIALLGAIVTHVITRDLDQILTDLSLPAALKETIMEQASRGLGQAGGDIPSGGAFEAVAAALKESFVAGMHVALTVAGGILLVGAVVALVLVKGGRPQAVHVPDETARPREDGLASLEEIPAAEA